MFTNTLTPAAAGAILTVVFSLSAATTAFAQDLNDRIRTSRGTEAGEVKEMTSLELKIAKKPAGTGTIAVNEIRSVSFDGEPNELNTVRTRIASGNFADAAEQLSKLNANAQKRDFVKQEIEFLQSQCAGKLALSGRGTINDAGRLLNAFVRAYPQNYHYFEAVELMGDLLAADGKIEAAQKQYNDLARAPWPEYKMHAAVSNGRALQQQGKHAEAIVQFDAALGMAGADPKSQSEKLSATLGKAVSSAETGKLEAAVSMIEKVIQEADPEQKELHARAYNALGTSYQRAGQTKDALLAFLHVDMLYNTVPEAHAEALANIATLYQAIGQEARAREARQTLQERYAGSRWAK